MSTPKEQIREKAQNILMLQSLAKSQMAQHDEDGLFDTLEELTDAANEVWDFSFENHLFDGLVVFVNTSSFVFRAIKDNGMTMTALQYAAKIGAEGLALANVLEEEAPEEIDSFQMVHFKLSFFYQVVIVYMQVCNGEDEKEAEPLLKGDILDEFVTIGGMMRSAYEDVRDIAPQSPYVSSLRGLYDQLDRLFNYNGDNGEYNSEAGFRSLHTLSKLLGELE